MLKALLNEVNIIFSNCQLVTALHNCRLQLSCSLKKPCSNKTGHCFAAIIIFGPYPSIDKYSKKLKCKLANVWATAREKTSSA